MLKIIDNDITRAGTKVGWISENDIYDEEGKKLGYFSDNDVYDANNKKLAYIDNNYINTADGMKLRLDENRKAVVGGSYSDLERAAIFLLIGD